MSEIPKIVLLHGRERGVEHQAQKGLGMSWRAATAGTAETAETVYRSLSSRMSHSSRRSLSSRRKRRECATVSDWSKVKLQDCCLPVSGGNPPPKFVQDGATFVVTLRKRIAPAGQVDDPINEGINEVIKEAIKSAPGIKKPRLVKVVGKSRATVERALADLVAAHVVEHRGSKKTGGYYPVEEGGAQ